MKKCRIAAFVYKCLENQGKPAGLIILKTKQLVEIYKIGMGHIQGDKNRAEAPERIELRRFFQPFILRYT